MEELQRILATGESDEVYVWIGAHIDSHALARIFKEPGSPFEVTQLPYGAGDEYSIGLESRIEEAYIEYPTRIDEQVIKAYRTIYPGTDPEPQCEISFDATLDEIRDPNSLLNVIGAYLVHKREPFFTYALTQTSPGSFLVSTYDPKRNEVLRPVT